MSSAVGKTSVSVDGMPAPIFFVNDRQINFQVPFETAVGEEATFEVSVDGLRGPSVAVPIAPVSPSVFVLPDGQGAVQNHEGSVESIKRGQFAVVFMTGLGSVEGVIETGEVTPFEPLLPVSTPIEVRIDGQSCDVLFAGLSPGSVALYQINFLVSEAISVGLHELTVLQAGVASNVVLVSVE